MLDRGFFKILVKELPMRYRKYIFDPGGGGVKAKNVEGGNYPTKYSEPYGTKKKSGLLKRQHRKFKNSYAPVASGDLLKDFSASNSGLTSGGMGFGFITDMGKVRSLQFSGRPIATDNKPLPTTVAVWVLMEAGIYTHKQWNKKIGNKDRHFRL